MKSIKKFFLALLVCLFSSTIPFGIASCQYLGDLNSNSNYTEPPSNTSEKNESDSFDDNSTPDDSTPDDAIPTDRRDFADTKYATTKIINNYVVHSDLTQQSSVASQDSESALKGAFSHKNGEAYTDRGANEVWTAVCFDLETFYGETQNLQGKSVAFDVRIQNCNSSAALSVMKADGIRQAEHSFNCTPYNTSSNFSMRKEILNDDWVRFIISLDSLFTSNILTNVKYVLLVFSNVGCDESIDSVYYIDNLSIQETQPFEWYTESYNPDGYYDKTECLNVHIVGNSFIYYSSTSFWLQFISDINGAQIWTSYTWTPNGRIPNQYENAFGANGYMNNNDHPDIIYIQDFYDFNDALALSDFAKTLMNVSPQTELKVYPGENETTDGIMAAERMGLDCVNWRAVIKELKSKNGFSAENLNDAMDGWHPNELSGVIGALMIYMDLYGEIPDINRLFSAMNTIPDPLYGNIIADYLPGENKFLSLSLIFELAASYSGL